MTQEGIKAFGTQWKVADVKIIEVPAIPGAMPKYKTTYKSSRGRVMPPSTTPNGK